MPALVASRDPFLSEFVRFETETVPAGAPWLRRLRSESISRFAELGLPTPKQEEWRYTDLAELAKIRFRAPTGPSELTPDQLAPFDYVGLEGPRIVFVDGRHAPALSRVEPLPAGVRVESLAGVLRDEPTRLEAHLGQYVDARTRPLVALNTAFLEDGAYVEIPDRTRLARPIQLLFVATPRPTPTVTHPRNLLRVGAESQVQFVESYIGVGDSTYFSNPVTELVVGEGAQVEHHKVQRESTSAFHLATLQVRQERASHFTSHSISFGAHLARNDLTTEFYGEGGECLLNGFYSASGRQHVDNHTTIDHRTPHCTSREVYKGVLDGEAKGVFYGKVFVRKDAQKTDASQTNKNLVLSEHALVNSTPALEINADDVKCSHASATGQLEGEALYYLRTRGIDETAARSVLTYAFARDVISRIQLPSIQRRLNELFLARLPNGAAVQEAL